MAIVAEPETESETRDGAAQERLSAVDLIGWFAENGRDLPWRRTRDPWAVLVAEFMLQQTQVGRVSDRWRRFLDRFPTVEACAGAAAAEVIDEWSGLGYNRRAVHLHALAKAVVNDHRGLVPRSLSELLGLPGVGRYTARAVRVFAFELADGVLDTNVARILARTEGASLQHRQAQELADRSVGPDPWAWNQAMLDVGAGYCTARSPDCDRCPFLPVCCWAAAGRPEPDPAVGSAAVSGRQSRFNGSDRQGRGRLVAALRSGTVRRSELAGVMGWPDDPDRAGRVAATLLADGLAVSTGDGLALPGR